MIISASRRTDIPAFYSDWFFNRIKEGYCTVPNPFNFNQISVVDLRPSNVDAFVFWTRNSTPMLDKLKLLDEKGYKYYFQYTVNNYPKAYERNTPSLDSSITNFKNLVNQVGKGRVILRYDPILLTKDLTLEFHLNNFRVIIGEIGDYTKRLVVSIVDDYKKTLNRITKIDTGFNPNQLQNPDIELILKEIVRLSSKFNIEVQSCAETKDFSNLNITHGKCIDDDILENELNVKLMYKKDKGQRLACGCMVSRDIGSNNTCMMGCQYCYATLNDNIAVSNFKKHDSNFSSILPHLIDEKTKRKIKDIIENKRVDNQLELVF